MTERKNAKFVQLFYHLFVSWTDKLKRLWDKEIKAASKKATSSDDRNLKNTLMHNEAFVGLYFWIWGYLNKRKINEAGFKEKKIRMRMIISLCGKRTFSSWVSYSWTKKVQSIFRRSWGFVKNHGIWITCKICCWWLAVAWLWKNYQYVMPGFKSCHFGVNPGFSTKKDGNIYNIFTLKLNAMT